MEERSDQQKADGVEKYLKVLAQIRLPAEPMIDNIIRFVNHSRRLIVDKDMTKMQKTGIEVYSDRALLDKNILADGMAGAYCPRSTPWYRYELPGELNFPRTSGMRQWTGKRMDEYPEVKKWLQDAANVTYTAFNFSNFYDVVTEFISDCVSVGTAHILAEEDVRSGRIVFTVPHFRECFIAEDQWGRIDTNYRLYKLTLRQLVDKFGYEKMIKLDRGFKEPYEQNMHAEREVIHAVFPRSDYTHGRIDGKGKPVASLWVLRGGSANVYQTSVSGTSDPNTKLLGEGGYDWMPSTTWRWRKNNDEWYGRSPAWDSWTSIALSNQEGKTNTIAGQKMAEPPMVVPSDLRGQVQRGPNGMTYIDPRGNLRDRAPFPLTTGIQLPFSVEAQEKTEKNIDQHFHVPFFTMLFQMAANKVTASPTQVIEMMGEQAAVLGTRIGNFENEGLNPIQDRVFEIEWRAGRMPQAPQILVDSPVRKIPKIMYLNPLAQAQVRLSKVRVIQSGVQMMAPLAQIFGPMALDRVDIDKTVEEILDAAGFPESCVRDDKMVQQIRENRAKEQQRQAQLEAMKVVPKAMAAAGKEVQDGSPLKKLMGGEDDNAG